MRVDSDAELDRALAELGDSGATDIAVEEFVEGHEGFYDTISIDGHPVYDFISHYYPNVLEAMRERWISPQFISHQPHRRSRGLRRSARASVCAPSRRSASKPRRPTWSGSSVPRACSSARSVAARPGVRAWDLYAAGNDIDIYREWANAIVHHRVERPLSRRRAAGIVALRPDRDGVISHYDGVEEVQRQFGEWILDSYLPPSGTPTQPVEAGYMANAWIRMAHPDYDTVHHMLNVVGETVRVRAS